MFTALFLIAAPIDIPKPAPTKPDEPLAKKFSVTKAAEYLDGVGVGWTRERKCITCHTNMPYLTARPLLPGDEAGRKSATFLEKDVKSWSNGGKPRGEAFVVVTAFALAFNDAQKTGKLHATTRAALDRMWEGQKKTGEWNWIKCDWPPLEHDDYFGATLAALAVGIAPDGYAKTDKAKAGIEKLRRTSPRPRPGPAPHRDAPLGFDQDRRPHDRRRAEEDDRGTEGEAAQGRRLVPALSRQLPASRQGQDAERPQRRERWLRHRLRHLRAPASRREANRPGDPGA